MKLVILLLTVLLASWVPLNVAFDLSTKLEGAVCPR